MQRPFKIKTKLSFSPSINSSSPLRVRAHFGIKKIEIPHLEIRERFIGTCRGSSVTPNKIKHSPSSLFKNARKIESNETFLQNNKGYQLSKTDETSTPNSEENKKYILLKPINCSQNVRSMSNSKVETSKEHKLIQRTVSIIIDGKSTKIGNQKDLKTTLSKIILGAQNQKNDLLFQVLDQSSIYGDQQNFVEMDSTIFAEAFFSKTQFQPLFDNMNGCF